MPAIAPTLVTPPPPRGEWPRSAREPTTTGGALGAAIGAGASPVPAQLGARGGTSGAALDILPHIHRRDHHVPDEREISTAKVCERYAKADALVFMAHGGFEATVPRCHGERAPLGIAGSECHVAIQVEGTDAWTRRNGGRSKVVPHAGVWFVDQAAQRSAHLSCGQNPGGAKAAITRAGGLLSLHHPEYPYIDKAPYLTKGVRSSAAALEYLIKPEDAAAFDMVEIWNEGPGMKDTNVDEILKWVERNFYARGLYPAMISGLDDHADVRTARVVHTLVDTGGSRDPAAIKRAIRENKTWVSTHRDVQVEMSKATISLRGLREGSLVQLVTDGEAGPLVPATGGRSGELRLEGRYAYAKVYHRGANGALELDVVTSAVHR